MLQLIALFELAITNFLAISGQGKHAVNTTLIADIITLEN